ncbi:NAD(P)/FAD-dependent oxidoreductase [Phanerochaete sordida]|uniref:NAD(P)/FAD-dependent oxidoreductase n=1 Tax=Phanerochaete sordida TaxID=48140 RepID=A0A9P3GD55_9APHY|nr:NAD(P)/FAD-dependent oxidoreductase [Phanerochaete sordida]
MAQSIERLVAPPPTAQGVATTWLREFGAALGASDPDAVARTFMSDGWLRDSLTFTWDNRALHGRAKIASFLTDTLPFNPVSNVALDNDPFFTPTHRAAPHATVEFGFRYETPVAWGRGYARLVQGAAGRWDALTVGMIVSDLKGHEEPVDGADWEAEAQKRTWGQLQEDVEAQIASNPTVLVVGGGQSGLQVAARFKQMGIPTLLIERNARIGDNWRQRYDSLALHTPREHHQLLYAPFPSNWPLYTPRDKLADWLEGYAKNQDLAVWTGTSILGRPTYDANAGRWRVTVERGGARVVLVPAHIVMATGVLGAPHVPAFAHRERFRGTVLHTTAYMRAAPFAGRRVIVVGAGNTAIDVCQDLVHARAAAVTMVQRSATCVVSRSNVLKHLHAKWAPGVPVGVCDLKNAATPVGFVRQELIKHQAEQWAEEEELHAKLRGSGLKLTLGADGQGQASLVYERLGGFWQDKGAADLIASGQIRIKQGVQPVAYSEDGLMFEDGSTLPADVIILATGYHNIRETNKQIFGPEVASSISEVHGLDAEGEVRGTCRPTGHPGLWFAGGDFYHSRFMSKQLGILIKANELGLTARRTRCYL